MARLMRRTMSLVAMLALAMAVFGSSGRAAAQGQATTAAPGTWESAINLQNNSDQAASPVVINFYNADGTLIKAYTLAEPIPARGAVRPGVEEPENGKPCLRKWHGKVSCLSSGLRRPGSGEQARVAQPAEHFLGKEEVMGSSPIASSGASSSSNHPYGIQNGKWPRLSLSGTSRT